MLKDCPFLLEIFKRIPIKLFTNQQKDQIKIFFSFVIFQENMFMVLNSISSVEMFTNRGPRDPVNQTCAQEIVL